MADKWWNELIIWFLNSDIKHNLLNLITIDLTADKRGPNIQQTRHTMKHTRYHARISSLIPFLILWPLNCSFGLPENNLVGTAHQIAGSFLGCVVFAELVEDEWPSAIIDFCKGVKVALGGLTKREKHLPFVELDDVVVFRWLDEGAPDIQKLASFLHEQAPERTRRVLVYVL